MGGLLGQLHRYSRGPTARRWPGRRRDGLGARRAAARRAGPVRAAHPLPQRRSLKRRGGCSACAAHAVELFRLGTLRRARARSVARWRLCMPGVYRLDLRDGGFDAALGLQTGLDLPGGMAHVRIRYGHGDGFGEAWRGQPPLRDRRRAGAQRVHPAAPERLIAEEGAHHGRAAREQASGRRTGTTVMHHRGHAREQPLVRTSATANTPSGSACPASPPQPVARMPRCPVRASASSTIEVRRSGRRPAMLPKPM